MEQREVDPFEAPATPAEVRQWAGFDADEPHKPRTNGTLYCELCGRIVSYRVHDV